MAYERKARAAALKLRINVDNESHMLEMRANGPLTEYVLDGEAPSSASIEEIRPGVLSILLGACSFTVNVVANGDTYEVVSSDGLCHSISVSDTRDRPGPPDTCASKGPAVIRAQMPGKIVTLLVEAGARVEAGQGLIVVEAMKMQNEVKAPKAGRVVSMAAREGATAAAGDVLAIIE